MLKKILVMGVVIVMAFGLFGCGGNMHGATILESGTEGKVEFFREINTPTAFIYRNRDE